MGFLIESSTASAALEVRMFPDHEFKSRETTARRRHHLNMVMVMGLVATLSLASGPLSEASGPVPLSQGFTYQGRFLTPDGTQPMTDTVNLTFSIYSGVGNCLLYQETDSNINLAPTQGLFSVVVGSAVGDPKRTAGTDPGLTLAQIFSNNEQRSDPGERSWLPGRLYSRFGRGSAA